MKPRIYLVFSLLWMVLLPSLLWGNAKDESTGSDAVVELDILAQGELANAKGLNFKRITEEFMALNPNVHIEFELLFDEPYFQKAAARVSSGDIPDIALLGPDARWGTIWAEADQLIDHRPFMDPEYYDYSLVPAHNESGDFICIPEGTTNLCTVLFANQGLLTELGLELPETYQDLVDMVPAAREAGLDVISFDGADGWAWGSCLMSTLVARYTGDAHFIPRAVSGEASFLDPGFIEALEMVQTMVRDGVLSENCVLVDYGSNLSNYSNRKALFILQGQWIAGDIGQAVADETVIMSLPAFPGEDPSMAGSCAGAMTVGYGITRHGSEDPATFEAAKAFLEYYNSHREVAQRLIEGAIVAPILRDFQVPSDISGISMAKIEYAQSVPVTTAVIDAYLSGPPNDALNTGCQQIASGQATPLEVAQNIDRLISE